MHILAWRLFTSVCQFLEQTDVRSAGAEVVQMEQDGVSEEFKRKVAKWEAAGVFDRIAAKVDEALDKEKP